MKTRWLKYTIGAGITAIMTIAVILFFTGRAFAPSGQTMIWTTYSDFFSNANTGLGTTTKKNVAISGTTHDVQLNTATAVAWGTPLDIAVLSGADALPAIAARNGKAYVAWQANVDAYGNPYYNYSTDSGVTWYQSSGVRAVDTAGAFDRNFNIVIGTDNIPQMVWVNNSELCYSKLMGTVWTAANGTAGYTSVRAASVSNPSIALDSTNKPHIVWRDAATGSGDIYYTKWNGSAWTKADGVTAGYDVIATTASPSDIPQLAVDSTNTPHVVWQESTTYQICYSKWSGTFWTKADGTTAGYDILTSTSVLTGCAMAVDTTNKPHVAWVESTSDTAYSRWNGSAWTKADGTTPGIDIIAVTTGSAQYPQLAVDSTNKPYVAWQDSTTGTGDIYFSKWNGSAWTKADGTTVGYDNVSNTALGSYTPKMVLDTSDKPKIVWHDTTGGTGNTLYYSGWSGTAWVKANGSSGSDLVGQMYNGVDTANIALALDRVKNVLHVAWRDYTNATIYYGNVFFSTFAYPGVIGGPAGAVGLRMDAGSNIRAKWDSISWNPQPVAANTAIKFRIRTADTTSGLITASWYGPSGLADMNDWTTNYFGSSNISGDTNPGSNSMHSSTPAARYADIMVKLDSSDGSVTPTLTDVTLTYNTLNKPAAVDVEQTKTDDSVIIQGGSTTGGSVKLKVSNIADTALFSSPKAEFELKDINVAFDGVTNLYSGSVVAGGVSTVTINGLTDANYHWRAHLVSGDAGTPQSDWTGYGANSDTPPAGVDFASDNGPPAMTITAPSTTYVTSTQPTFTATVTDTVSGVNYVKFQYKLSTEPTIWTDLNTATNTPYVANWGAVNLASGSTYNLRVTSADNAGNTGNSTAVTTTCDTSAPVSFDLSSPADNAWVTTAAPTFSWNAASDPQSGIAKYVLYIDGSVSIDNIPNTSTSIVSNTLAQGTHTWKVTAVNNAGLSTDSTSTRTVGVDFTLPTIASMALTGNVSGSAQYVNSTTDNQVVKATGIFNDAGGSSGALQVQFSEDSINWGIYNGSVNYTTGGAGWGAGTYATVNASTLSQDITAAWRFATPDGAKTLVWRLRDGAGNQQTYTTPPTFSSAGGSLWQYKKPIVITGSTAGAVTNYAVPVIVNTASLVSAGKMQATGADIRFSNTSDSGELPYWIESGMNTVGTKIWVKVNAIPASPSTATVYMYYGNANATVVSSGRSTFELFDDFETGTVDNTYWTLGGTLSPYWAANGTTSYQGTYSGASVTGLLDNGDVWMKRNVTLAAAGIVEFYWSVSSENNFDYLYYCVNNDACTRTTGYTNRIAGTVGWLGTGYAVAGTANRYFNQPYSVAADSSGKIYVADPGNYRVQVFDSSYAFVRGIGNGTTWTGAAPAPVSGNTNSSFANVSSPWGVAVDSAGKIYAVDSNNYRVQVFNSSGAFVLGIGNGTTWTGTAPTPASGITNGYFSGAAGIAVDSSGKIYVADTSNHRIQIFDASGNFVRGIGNGTTWTGVAPAPSSGNTNGYFYYPASVAVDSSGNIYVGDRANYRVQIFNSSGAFVRGIGNGTTWTGAAPTPSSGNANGYFFDAYGIAVDSAGNIYVGDSNNARVQIFTSSGAFVRGIGNGTTWTGAAPTPSTGVNNAYFNYPRGISVDSSGNIYVADASNARIQIFNSSGAFVRGIGYGITWTPTISSAITSGTRSIKFAYGKDASGTQGSNMGWVDYVKVRLYVTPEPLAAAPGSEGGVQLLPVISLDTTAPTNSITAPSNNANVNTTQPAFTADVTDAVSGVASVKFQYKLSTNGTYTDLNTDTVLPYAADWAATNLADGSSYNLAIVSTDNAGNVATSSSITITCDMSGPTGSITAPLNNAFVNTAQPTFTADATDPTGIASVKFQYKLSTDGTYTDLNTDTTSPYAAVWDGFNLADGSTYNLRIISTDNANNPTTSTPIAITCDMTPPPAVSTLAGPAATNIDVALTWTTVSDSLSGTAFYRVYRSTTSGVLGSKINTDGATTTGSYADPAAGLTNGTNYYYTVRAVDNAGNEQIAGNNQISVKYDTTAPSGGSISYADGATSSTSAVITLTDGTDWSGLATKVLERAEADYTNDTVGSFAPFAPLFTSPVSPYTDNTLAAGKAYKYRYVITDNAGNPTTYTSTSTVKVYGPTAAYFLSAPLDIVAGQLAQYTVTRKDTNGNSVFAGVETVILSSTSTGANKQFRATSNGPALVPATINIPNGSKSVDFFYYDELMGAYEIKASSIYTAGTYDTPGTAYSVSVSGNYAYVADGASGLQIVNISNPASPTLTGTYATPDVAFDVAVSGNYAYVADNAAGLLILDISNPASPAPVGSYNTPGTANGVDVSGNYAYVSDGASGLQIIDISTPANPALAGVYNTPGASHSVDVVGNYAYMADGASGVQIVDISNPASPTLAGTCVGLSNAFDVHVSGNYAHVADRDAGLKIFDISNPAAPVPAGSYDTPGSAYYVSLSGNYVYLADATAGIRIVNVSNPAAPTFVDDQPLTDSRGIFVSGNYVYVADNASGLRIVYARQVACAKDSLNVAHYTPDHLKFSSAVSTPQKAGAPFVLPTLEAVDAFGNILNNLYGASDYSGSKPITYTLSGQANAPNGSYNDSWTTSVSFTNGVSTIPLTTTLMRAQTTTITASSKVSQGGELPNSPTVPNEVTNAIVVDPEMADSLIFQQQPLSPPTSYIINSVLPLQPIVKIQDIYGNKAHDNSAVTLSDSSTPDPTFTDGPGDLSMPGIPVTVNAVDGTATFTGVRYNNPATIYMYAEASGISPEFSNAVEFTMAPSSAVEAAAAPVANFNIIPTNDTEAEKFPVLKFKVHDFGGDSTAILVDKVVVTVGGTGGNASSDIAWAELTDGISTIATATGSNITNSAINFGAAAANSDSIAQLMTVPDNTSVEYTVNVYMKPGKLASLDNSTYIFSIDETGVLTDTGLSSRMGAASGLVAPVTGTLTVVTSYLEVLTTANESSITANAGQSKAIKLTAVDANKNIDRDYTGNHTFKFSGLNPVGGYTPNTLLNSTPPVKNFGTNNTINFTTGVSGTTIDLTAYKKEIGNVSVVDQAQPAYLCFPLTVDVAAGGASTISVSSGNNQTGAINGPLALPFVALVSDTYGNPAQGVPVTFAIGTYPGGATGQSLSSGSGNSDALGLVSTTLTFGNIQGTYTAVATSGTLSGSPLTFTGSALAPTAMNIISGTPQTDKKVTEQTAPFVVEIVAGASKVPNVSVNFTIASKPSGTTGEALSAPSAMTDTNGRASVTLTLGDKTGTYTIRASFAGFTQDFTVVAQPQAPNKIVLTGSSSVKAGDMSTAFNVSVQDQFSNNSPVTADTILSLTNAPSVTGVFYRDLAGTDPIVGNQITIASGASNMNFYYRDDVTASLTIGAQYVSGQAGLVVTSASLPFTVIPADIDHLAVTGNTSPMDAGGSKTITITAYDLKGNVKNDYQGNISVVFTGANPSPAPSNQAPTVNNVPFNTATLLDFTNGAVQATLKLYKAQTAVIKATAGSTTTPDPSALTLVVKHLAVDHLKFGADIPTPQTAGQAFNFETTIDAADLYNNICDGANGAPVFDDPSKTITYTLSGASDGPETGTDVFTNPVAFVSGRTTTVLSATLFRAQDATITPSTVGIAGTNVASNLVRVNSTAVDHLRFSQQPSATGVTTQPLAQQPKVAVADQYGNPIKNAVAQITLRASLTQGVYTPVLNGVLTAAALSKNVTNGEAAFSGLTYNYPEDIYLEASVAGYNLPTIYSFKVTFATAEDASITKIAQSGSIDSYASSEAAAEPVLGFRIADAGSDGFATKIKQIVIKNTNTGTTANWTDFITSATLSDGVSQPIPAFAVANNRITFGSGTSVLANILDGTQKTYTLKLVLKAPLPAGADNEAMNFSIDVTQGDISLEALGSKFLSSSQPVTDAATIIVKATNFKITSATTMLNAGQGADVALKAVDVNGNVDEDYSGDRSLVFSGSNPSPKGDKATVTVATTAEFADTYGATSPVIIVPFAGGVNTSTVTVTPYKAEVALVKAYEASGPYNLPIGTSDPNNALQLIVNGGAADQLFWAKEPKATCVANAPWDEFVINITDRYGNTAPSSVDVTVNIDSGGTLGASGTNTVTAVNGEAHFTNFTATAATYPAALFVTGTAPGISAPTSQFGPVVLAAQYSVTLNVKDSVTNTALPEITLQVLQGNTVVYGPPKGNSPFTFQVPYGNYTISLDKEKYVQYNKDVTAGVGADAADGVYDNNITLTLYMTSLEEATADYQVKSTFVYDEVLDKLTIRLWLERRGKLIINSLDSINKLGDSTITIFDETANDWMTPLIIAHPAFTDYTNGVYRMDITNVTKEGSPLLLTSGKTYFARCAISYGGADGTGKLYETGTTFTITVTQSLKAVTDQIKTLSADIATQVTGVKTTVATEAATTRGKVAEVKTDTQKIVTATETTIPQQLTTETGQITTQLTTMEKSQILNRETSVLLGTTINIRYRTYANAAPIITVYDPTNNIKIAGMPMAQVSPGIYEYAVSFAQGWAKGDYSIVCQEPNYGTMDAITITAKTADIETVSSNVSTVLGSVAPVKDIKTTVDAFSAAFSVIEANIKKASEALAGVKSGSTEALQAADQVSSLFNTLKEMSAKIHELGGTLGYDLEKLYEVSDAKSKDINYIRNKTQELKALMLLNQQMVENVAKEEPVVQTWFEFR